ncbi:L,D-transpeptidase [Gemmatimonas phototrophica]|nr:L,D-transpeptidase [Gemmatimonas phototrophica]
MRYCLLLVVATSGCATAASVPSVNTLAPPPPHMAAASALLPSATVPVISAPRFVLTPRNVRLVISVAARRLWVIAGPDTLHTAPVSVASGRDLVYAGRTWRFATPRGRLVVLGKRANPVWLPPDWHYAEVAQQHGLRLAQLRTAVPLRNGDRLLVRDSVVGVIRRGRTAFLPLPVNEHLVFDGTLFIPPIATRNRRLQGELGRHALDLGNGYMLHGTTDQLSIGSNTTHGCIRLADGDLSWLYTYVPVGVSVVIR